MPNKKEEWVTGKEAADLLTQRSGHTIKQDYIRWLSREPYAKIRSKPLDGRTNVYNRSDLEKLVIKQKEPTKKGTTHENDK
jgi:hypothetical protein